MMSARMQAESDHWDGRRFFNPTPESRRHSDLREVARWLATRKRPRWERVEAPPGPPPADNVGGGDLRVTWVGHATALIQMDGLNLLTDPIWEERCSPLAFAGPRRFRPPGLRFGDLPRIDAVLLSHDHYDHLCVPTLRRLAKRAGGPPKIVTGLRVGEVLRRHGIPNARELDWWESTGVAEDVRIIFTPAQHFSGRGPNDRDRTLWGGLFVESPSGGVYYAGDTGYGPHFHQIRERLGEPRLALLPIGAYEPRWFMGPVHMNPAEAVRAHIDLGARTSVAVHFGSFALADDGQEQPVNDLERARDSEGVDSEAFRILEHGIGTMVPV